MHEERIYRLLFEHSVQGMVLQQSGRLVLVNQSFADMVGYTIEELLEFSADQFTDLIHPDDRDIMRTHFQHPATTHKGIVAHDYRFIRQDGQIGWWSATVTTIVYQGDPSVLGTYIDITERKQAEESSMHGRQFLSDTLDALPVGVCLTDEGGYYQMMNDAYCAIYDYDRNEMLGQHYGVIMPPDQLALANEHYARLLSGDMGIPVERKRQRKNGSIIHIEAANALVYAPDGEKMVITTVRDITDRKEVQETLIQLNAELQARNEDLNAFAHTVAHDLKTPVAVVAGFAEVLQGPDVDLASEVVHEQLTLISSYAMRMSRIIDDLLLLSSVQGQETVEIAALDMAWIIAEAQMRLKEMIHDYEGELVLPPAWPDAMGYAPWVVQVWVNYLSNALKYGGTSPRLELGADEIDGGQIRFWVKDNGKGLSAADQQRIFQPFERLGQRRMEGHGLGLSIVRRIVEKLGGQVGIESQLGAGSTFYFTLPACAGDPGA